MKLSDAIVVLETRRAQCIRIADIQVGMTGSVDVRSMALGIEIDMRMEAEALAVVLERLTLLETLK